MEAGENVDALAWNPTSGDWRLYLPCAAEDFDWAKRTLAERAPRFVVIKPGHTVGAADDPNESTKSESLTVNWGVFGK